MTSLRGMALQCGWFENVVAREARVDHHGFGFAVDQLSGDPVFGAAMARQLSLSHPQLPRFFFEHRVFNLAHDVHQIHRGG